MFHSKTESIDSFDPRENANSSPETSLPSATRPEYQASLSPKQSAFLTHHLEDKTYRHQQLKGTLTTFESQAETLAKENKQLKQTISLLEAKFSILNQEKELHIQEHTHTKIEYERKIKALVAQEEEQAREFKWSFNKITDLVEQIYISVSELSNHTEPETRQIAEDIEKTYKKKLEENQRKIQVKFKEELENRLANTQFSRHEHTQSQVSLRSKAKSRQGLERNKLILSPRQSNEKLKKLEKLVEQLENQHEKLRNRVEHLETESTTTLYSFEKSETGRHSKAISMKDF